jgi:hypothetical protein
VNNIVEESYIVKDGHKIDYTSMRYTSKKIRFGTYKEKNRVPEDHCITPEDMQAHKVNQECYILTIIVRAQNFYTSI